MAAAGLLELLQVAFASVVQGQLPPSDIIKALIHVGLGYAILAGACITKLPQITNITKSRSAEGLSAVSFELETYALLVHSAYGYVNGLAFSSYGEALILVLQNLVILALVYKYSGAPLYRSTFCFGAYVAMAAAVVAGHVQVGLIRHLYDANNLVVMVSRVPQIIKNFSEKSTGQLSGITYLINVVGCVVRVFTSLQEGAAGVPLVRSYLISLALNLTLVLQILLYCGKAKKPAAASAKEETKKTK